MTDSSAKVFNQSKGPKGFSVSSPDKVKSKKQNTIEAANFTIMPKDVQDSTTKKLQTAEINVTLGNENIFQPQ